MVAAAAVAAAWAAGCQYQKPPLEEWYGEVVTGMDRGDVIEILGEPTAVIEGEMFYIYDDPDDPARFRFVLNEEDIVVEKYLEWKEDLYRKAEETMGEAPPEPRLPAETEETTYPGGPLPKFETKFEGPYD
jgi:outer membrane protein assembly factor BamE (lipoprotein component of BamABCDE complex)